MTARTFALAAGLAAVIVGFAQAQGGGQQPATGTPNQTPPSGTIQFRTLVQSGLNAEGAKIEYPTTTRPEITAAIATLEPGARTPRHMHPVPLVVYVLEGALEHRADGRQPVIYTAGQAFIEGQNEWHEASNAHPGQTRVFGVYMGEQGKPHTVVYKRE